jgi:sec-independent protein translocase protein TatA
MFDGILQPMHLILILVIVLIIFGPGKLPELGKSLGQAIHDLRESASGTSEPAKEQADEQPRTDK